MPGAIGSLPDTAALAAFCATAAAALAPGSSVALDFAPAELLRNSERHERLLRDDEDELAFVVAEWDEARARLHGRLVTFRRHEAQWWREEAPFVEYSWSEEAIVAALVQAGLAIAARLERTNGSLEGRTVLLATQPIGGSDE